MTVTEATVIARCCPHCALHCEDGFDSGGNLIVDCSLARQRQDAATNQQARWIDSPSDTSDVLRKTIRQLGPTPDASRASDLVITFGSMGMGSVQSLLRSPIASKFRFVGDRDRTIDVLMKSLIRESLVSATLGDVRQHADHVWLVGEFESTFPRIHRWISPSARCESLDLLTENDLVRIANPHGSDQGRYLSIVIGPGGLGNDANDSAVLAEMLLSRVRRHNASGRSRVTLTWIDPVVSAASVHGWMTNRRLLTNRGEARIRLGSPVPGSLPVALQIGGLDGGPALSNGFLPSPIPGVTRSDVSTRGDGTVTVPLPGQARLEEHDPLQSHLKQLIDQAR